MNNVAHAPWPSSRRPNLIFYAKMRGGRGKRYAGKPFGTPAQVCFYFLAGAGAAAPEPLKYLKKSELESITITSP